MYEEVKASLEAYFKKPIKVLRVIDVLPNCINAIYVMDGKRYNEFYFHKAYTIQFKSVHVCDRCKQEYSEVPTKVANRLVCPECAALHTKIIKAYFEGK